VGYFSDQDTTFDEYTADAAVSDDEIRERCHEVRKFARGGAVGGRIDPPRGGDAIPMMQRIGQVIRPDGSIMCEYARRN
jgi:hypothetical protein